METILKHTSSRDLVLQFHSSTGKACAESFHGFLDRFGSTCRVHFVHMGLSVEGHMTFVPCFLEWLQQGFEAYCDTSLACGFAVHWITQSLQAVGGYSLRHLLFASDSPFGDFPSESSKVLQMPSLSPLETVDVIRANAELVYNV